MLSTAPQVKINLTLLQHRTAVVGAETAIWALQLTATDAVEYEQSFSVALQKNTLICIEIRYYKYQS